MDTIQMAKTLDGIYSVETLAKKLGVSNRTAINYISKLRKDGFVKTEYGTKRLYTISPLRLVDDGESHIDVINKYSSVKIKQSCPVKIHNHKITIEETLVNAISSGDYRLIIAAIPLFNHVTNWSRLKEKAQELDICNKVGALYDIARKYVKTKRMDNRTRSSLLLKKKSSYLLKGSTSRGDFKEIGLKWNVYIGLKKSDLMRLKNDRLY